MLRTIQVNVTYDDDNGKIAPNEALELLVYVIASGEEEVQAVLQDSQLVEELPPNARIMFERASEFFIESVELVE